ncbi:MAG: indolepyruvate oxidoreductase subunit beta family protein [Ruegeria sp.]
MTTAQPNLSATTVEDVIKLAIMAVGGQGGGVLTNWIESCARTAGYHVQATSVAGVAQRTGATIYYIEMAPATEREPVFALMPSGGDVDILVAAEMMEAGRAILRGFVTPDKTTLITSTHRALAVSEKTVPGDGMANSAEVHAAAEVAAQRFIPFDMEAIAQKHGSVISASLLGALAGANCLPFPKEAFEAAIKGSGRGIDASLRAFDEAFRVVRGEAEAIIEKSPSALAPLPTPKKLEQAFSKQKQRIDGFPEAVREVALAGLRATVDFQDLAYGDEYLTRLSSLIDKDSAPKDYAFSTACAKYLARAMVYDDVVRVADLKTRRTRFDRIRQEMTPPIDARLRLTEFMHPRAEELVGLMPARMGGWVTARPSAMRRIDRLFNRGRRVRTDRLIPFLQLYFLAGLRRWRRGMLRHQVERQHWESWLAQAEDELERDYDLAVELVRNRRLIKGYSDTHSRGMSKFDTVSQGASLVAGRSDAAAWVRRLREAALADADGDALEGAMATVRTFADG